MFRTSEDNRWCVPDSLARAGIYEVVVELCVEEGNFEVSLSKEDLQAMLKVIHEYETDTH